MSSRGATPRSPRKKWAIVLYVVLAVVLIAVVSAYTGKKVTSGTDVQPTSELIGHHVKSFTLDGLNGGTVNAPWKSHHASVLVFFASYCGPCQGEMPKIATYIRHHHPSPVVVLAVDASDVRSHAQAMIEKDRVTFPVAFDPNAVVTTNVFGFNAVPESVFINAKGVVTNVYFGAIPEQRLAAGIKTLKSSL